MTDPDTTTHDDLEGALERIRSDIGAAEMHGMVCGALVAPADADESDLLRELLGDTEPGDLLYDECRRTLLETRDAAASQLESAHFGFNLLLPADTETLSRRTEALASWCGGFLYGLGVGGLDEEQPLSGDASELLQDLSEFTRMRIDPGDHAEQEAAYMELVEYVRMGVLLLREELAALRADGGEDEDPTLH